MIQVIKDIISSLISKVSEQTVYSWRGDRENGTVAFEVSYVVDKLVYHFNYSTSSNRIGLCLHKIDSGNYGTSTFVTINSELDKSEILLLFTRLHENCKELVNTTFRDLANNLNDSNF